MYSALRRCSFYKIDVVNNVYCRKVSNSFESNATNLPKIKRYFKLLNIPIIDGNSTLLVKDCTWCNVQRKKSCDVFINKRTGHFLCQGCKITASWEDLQSLISQAKSNNEKGVADFKAQCVHYDKSSVLWNKIVEENENLDKLTQNEIDILFTQFGLPSLPQKLIEKLKIHVNNDRTNLYFPLSIPVNGKIVGFSLLKKDNIGCHFKTFPKTDCPGYLMYSNSKNRKEAVLVNTIHDWCVLVTQNIAFNVICLPYGHSNLPQNMLCFLEDYEKLILWFRSGIGVSDAARNFAKKLNDKRCYIVMPTENQSSPYVAVSKGESIKKILMDSQPTWHQSITTFSSLREDVLSEFQNYEKVQGVKWKRYPMLNKILKGHRRGELTILTGPTGSGKTTFMSEYSLDLAQQGVNTLFGSFEIRNVRLARTMLQQFAEKSLDENVCEFDEWADLFEQLPVYFMTFHGQQTLKDVMEAVEHASYVHDISHVIIDNVQFMMGMTEENKFIDRFWRQDNIIHCFRSFATKYNCHVTLVIHPRKEKETEELTTSSIFGGAKAAQEADNILIVQDKRLTSVKGRKYLQVAKNRYTGDLGIMPLDFIKESLSYATKKKKIQNTQISNENIEMKVEK